MTRLPLTLACWDYDRTRALRDGSIKPEGIDLTMLTLRPSQTFPRMLKHKEFDVSEMSFSSYCALKAQDDCPFVAIPVFPSKIFRHDCIYVNVDAGIERPEDLAGKRIGSARYDMTAALFARGMLHHDYGVTPQSVEWFYGPQEELGGFSAAPHKTPVNISVSHIAEGKILSQMLDDGELDALIGVVIPEPFLRGSAKVKRLFPNFKEAEQEYFRRTRIFPIMHTVVIREEIFKEHPFVARSLYDAFTAAKDEAAEQYYDTDALRVMLPFLLADLEEAWALMGKDFWAYGVEPNRPTIEALLQFLHDQELADRVLSPEELFAPSTLGI
jgi:4,5-dihydroxyphthalate decarboxylase